MEHCIKEFYYLYNFFDLYKSIDLASALLIYKKEDWNTGNVKGLGYALADDNISNERECKRISSISVKEIMSSILIGLDNRDFNHGILVKSASSLREVILDFRASLCNLVDAEIIPDVIYFDDKQFELVIKVLILELKRKYSIVEKNDNSLRILFYLIDKYSIRIFDFIFWFYRSESAKLVSESYVIRDVIIKHPILINRIELKQFVYDEDIDGYWEDVIYEDNKLISISIFDAINSSAFTDNSTIKYVFEMQRHQSMRNRFEQKISLLDKVLTKNELSFIKGRVDLDEEFAETYFDDILTDVLDGDTLEKLVEYIFGLIDTHNIKEKKIIDFYFGITGVKTSSGERYQPIKYVPLILHPLFLCLKKAMIIKVKKFEIEM
jgi:hypothetical protein